MNKTAWIYGLISIVASSVIAQAVEIDKVQVTDTAETEGASVKTISEERIDNRVGPGQTNPYKALDMEPSVHVGQADTYGLSLDQNSFRIRGLYADTFSRLSLLNDGVPSVVNVGQGAMGSLIDMENIESMTFTAGAANADSGFGFGNNAGTIDMKLKKASDSFEAYLKQSIGADDFQRTFVRLDSGKLPYDIKFFVSASKSSADKWRGKGDTDRDNIEAGVTVPISSDVKFDLFWAHNTINRNDYRPLTYTQTLDLDANYDVDFNPTLTGSAASDKFYYDFNKQDFNENLIQGNLEINALGGLFTIKPYRIDTDGWRMSYNGSNNTINKALMEQEQTGFVARYDTSLPWAEATLGYWFQTIDTLPPPTGQKNYQISGGALVFNTWNMLNDVGSRVFNSPFLMLKKKIDNVTVQAGVKYLEFKLPSIQGYTTTAGDVSYDEAMALATKDTTMYVDAIKFHEVLPSLNLRYQLNNDVALVADYARGYANPWNGPLYSVYKSNKANFTSHGITLQDLWNTLKLETSDTYDIGMKIHGRNWRIEPTLYYIRYQNKQVSAYDPVTSLNYYQSNAKAEGKGVELSMYYEPIENIELFGALSYNRLNFTQNLTTTGGAVLDVEGNQVPDAPKRLAKAGVTMRYGGFYLTPAVRYVDSRYGDILNTQKVPSYTVVDLEGGYVTRNVAGFKELSASLSVQNLFDRHYIAIIKNDLDDTGTNGAGYYPGAPASAIMNLSLRF